MASWRGLLRLDRLTGTSANGWATQPWRAAEDDGIYISNKKDVWMYRTLPLASVEYEDAGARLAAQQKIERLLIEIGDTTKDLGQGVGMLAQKRGIHILTILHEKPNTIGVDVSAELAKVQKQMMFPTTVDKVLVIGIKLRRDSLSALTSGDNDESKLDQFKQMAEQRKETDISAFQTDYTKMNGLCSRAGGRIPTPEERTWMESWFNSAKGTDTKIATTDTRLHVADGTTWQISALMGIDEQDLRLHSPEATWALDAMNHTYGANVISIRAELEPASVTRGRSRRSQRILRNQEEEEEATGDVSRDEIKDKAQTAKLVENYIRDAGNAWLSETSVLFARRVEGPGELPPDETFADALAGWYGFNIKTLEKRQLNALAEMLPGSTVRVNPFKQDVNPAWVAYAGLNGFGAVGDDRGILAAESSPHATPVLLDPGAAARLNAGPAMCIFGRPGSGKASSVDALILTPRGWKRMGDIAVGDTITGSDGRNQKVLGVFPQGEQDLYTVTFSDGSTTQVTGDHWWTVTTSGAKSVGRTATLRTTLELQSDLVDGSNKLKWQIPMMAPAQFPATRLPLDPYLLGALLGDDGLSAYVGFSSKDQDVLDRVRLALPSTTKLVSGHKRYDYRIVRTGETGSNKVMNALRSMKLFGLKSSDKHIPSLYLRAPLKHRIALLQGLMDTEGEVTARNSLIFNTSSPQLRDGIVALVQSLGGTACSGEAKIPFYKHNGQLQQGLPAWRITVRLPAHIEPFHCSRKADAFNAAARYEPVRTMTKIEKTGRGLAQCIKVSNADSLYITDDYIATHNTFAAQLIAGQAALNGGAAILINPKGHDSLAPFAYWIKSCGVPATVVSLSALTKEGGAFDPFRFAEPTAAAEILTRHILNIIGVTYEGGLNGAQEIELRRGLNEAAAAGARCAHDAMKYMRDPYITKLVEDLAESSALFQLGYGYTPGTPWGARSGYTLIEFDRDMGWPAPGKNAASYDGPEREAVGALRLISRASIEILMRSGGGTLVVDEAHHFLASAEGRATIDRINREGRSLGLLPIFCTQRVTDLVGGDERVDMETFLSRVLALRLPDKAEAKAALILCGLEPTEDRLAFLRTAPSGLGFFRDIHDRHGVVRTGAGITEEMYLAMSTNSEDRKRRGETIDDEL